MEFTIKFTGRTKGAIGIFQEFTETVEAETIDQAIIKLYDNYEHVHFFPSMVLSKTENFTQGESKEETS